MLASVLIASVPLPIGNEVGIGYKPQDKDERGLWMLMDEEEHQLKSSSYVITDQNLNIYVHSVFCRTVGQERCKDVRIYITRNPYFNASMAPNGMMVVWSGLLLRVRDEAELADILGHEYTHYQNKHSLKLFRNIKSNTAAAGFMSFIPYVGSLLALGTLSSIFSYSRDNETEADAGGLSLIVKAGYDPMAASQIWEQQREEVEATAAARNAKPRYNKGGMFATHPNDLERMTALKALAEKDKDASAINRGENEYRKAMAPWWPVFIDDQIKLNDFGGTELLLGQLAQGRWTPDLLFARGELYRTRGKPDDLKSAAGYYHQAIISPDAPVEAWRGLGLALLRSGAQVEGQSALKTYLTKKPDASDKAMMAMLSGG